MFMEKLVYKFGSVEVAFVSLYKQFCSGVVGTKADLEEQLKRIDLQKQLQQLPNQQLPG